MMCSCFMGVDLDVTATPQHIDNHKAYVQAWIQSIRDKPETLIRAIKDAQAAATYMDYKAGLITDKEYEQACGSVLEVKQKERETSVGSICSRCGVSRTKSVVGEGCSRGL